MFADVGLEMLQNVHRLKDMIFVDGCLSGKYLDRMPAIPADLDVECLTFCTGQEQTHVTGLGVHIHARALGLGLHWRTAAMAVALSGLKPSEKAGTLIPNVGRGPWQAAVWFNASCAHGNRISTKRRPNDQIVLRHLKTHLL